jgi:RNA polymerase sigma factor, sigma-70 family
VEKVQIFARKGTAKSANKDLLETILLKKYDQYYRLAYSYVHNDADACDIVQNGAYKALRGSGTLKNAAFAETWVYRIMLNECFRHLRQPRKYSYESMQETGFELSYTEDNCDKIDLRRALDALPEKDKAVVILRYFEDRKLEEIADILEENVNTVKSRLYRSIKKLRDHLEDS